MSKELPLLYLINDVTEQLAAWLWVVLTRAKKYLFLLVTNCVYPIWVVWA